MPSIPNRPSRAAPKSLLNQAVRAAIVPTGQQDQRLLFPVKDTEFQGVAMGVLSDGTPYLHLRGLAKLCGIDSGMLSRLVGSWREEREKPRGQRIVKLLEAQGFRGDTLHIMTMGPQGETPAYTDAVCMALLEYYAFDAKQGDSSTAQHNFRLLARTTFRQFIYKGCGYDPDAHIPEAWKVFHQRILLNDQMPMGYFSVFREMADLTVHMIKGGCEIDNHTVPDISVGMGWSNHWNKAGLARVHGERIKHPHFYPDWFPQAEANPVAAWIYPDSALRDFRQWLYAEYLKSEGAFHKYIGSKVQQGKVLPARAEALKIAMQRPAAPQAPSFRRLA